MANKFNDALREMIVKHVATSVNPAAAVSDILNIGREAAYRRLRGEVFFTFDEAAQLSARLDFSLDELMSGGQAGRDGRMFFRLNYAGVDGAFEHYNDTMEYCVRFFREAAQDPTTIWSEAGSQVPPEFYMKYEKLTQFKLFRWLYQRGVLSAPTRTFESMPVSDRFMRNCREYVDAVRGVAMNHYLFDNNGIRHWVHALRAFRTMRLITDKSFHELRDELSQLIDEVEIVAAKGEYSNGNKVQLYLSHVDLEANYTYFMSRKQRISGVGLFAVNSLYTHDTAMFEYVKHWIEMQNRFATLISCSGELQRIGFIERQRKLLCELEREESCLSSLGAVCD